MIEQKTLTKQFIKHVESLLDKGTIKNHVDVVDTLQWNKSSMSNVINGRMNIPYYLYVKFKETYGIVEVEPTSSDSDEYKEKYYALLENHVNHSSLVLHELREIKELLKKISDHI